MSIYRALPWQISILVAVVLGLTAGPASAKSFKAPRIDTPILLDGLADDWYGYPRRMVKDLQLSVAVAHSADSLYLQIQLPVNGLIGPLTLWINADNDKKKTSGILVHQSFLDGDHSGQRPAPPGQNDTRSTWSQNTPRDGDRPNLPPGMAMPGMDMSDGLLLRRLDPDGQPLARPERLKQGDGIDWALGDLGIGIRMVEIRLALGSHSPDGLPLDVEPGDNLWIGIETLPPLPADKRGGPGGRPGGGPGGGKGLRKGGGPDAGPGMGRRGGPPRGDQIKQRLETVWIEVKLSDR